jgi:hypothetical protein
LDDLADLNPLARREFEQRNDGSWLYFGYLRLYAKSRQLLFQDTRPAFELIFIHPGFVQWRIIKQIEPRQPIGAFYP